MDLHNGNLHYYLLHKIVDVKTYVIAYSVIEFAHTHITASSHRNL